MKRVKSKRSTNGKKVSAAALPIVGILSSGSADANGQQIAAFISGLSNAGYTDGDNVTIMPTWAGSVAATLATNAANLVSAPSAVIVAAGGTVAAVAAKTATATIPIVFTSVADPVANGLVTSLDNPGGNLTGTAGLTAELDPMRLQLLKEFDPARTTIGVLTNSSRKNFTAEYADLQAAAARLQLTLEKADATKPGQIDTAINGFSANVQAILVTADPMFNDNRGKVVRLIKNRTTQVPAIYQWRDFVTGGGLMSYGPSIADAYKTAGSYVGQILDGDSPKDMPVKLPSTYELVINLKTANKMGFRIPTSMLIRATLVRRKG